MSINQGKGKYTLGNSPQFTKKKKLQTQKKLKVDNNKIKKKRLKIKMYPQSQIAFNENCVRRSLKQYQKCVKLGNCSWRGS